MAKKLLSAVLALLMVMALVPMSVLAKGENPGGSKDDPKWVEVTSLDEIVAGETYLIGYKYDAHVYLLSYCKPSSTGTYHSSVSSGVIPGTTGTSWPSYAVEAELDNNGKVIGVNDEKWTTATMDMVKWNFIEGAGANQYKLQVSNKTSYYLVSSSADSYADTYAQQSSTSNKWTMENENGSLYIYYGHSETKHYYLKFYPNLATSSDGTCNLFTAWGDKDDNAKLTFYKIEPIAGEYTLTINITYPAGHDPASETITRQYHSGAVVDLSAIIPAIQGFTSNYDGVTYTMPYHDDTINVTYSATFNYAVNAPGETRSFVNDTVHPWNTAGTGTGTNAYYAEIKKSNLSEVGTSSFSVDFTAAKDDLVEFDYGCYAWYYSSSDTMYGGTLSVKLLQGTEVIATLLDDFYDSSFSWHSDISYTIQNAGSYKLVFSYESTYNYSSTSYYARIDNVKIYTPVTATLTINYEMESGATAAAPETYTASVVVGKTYSVTSPDVYGYAPDKEVVSGTMVAEGVTETVTYHATTTIDDVIKVGGFTEHFTTSSPKWTIVDATHPNPHYPDTVYDDHPSYAIAGNFNVNSSDSDLLLTLTGEAAAQLAGKKIKFDYLVDSENSDHGYFYVNGVQKLDAKGYTSSPAWKTFTYEFTDADVTSGTVELKWRYHKDVSIHSGFDVFYLDNVEIYAPDKNNVVISCVSGSDTLLTLSIPVEVGEAFNIAYPTSADHSELVGYRLASGNTPIEGTMGDTDMPFTVNYEPIPQHQLTISYTLDGKEFASPYTAMLYEGDTYSVKSPAFDGYTASRTTVYGTMGTENITVEVTYTANPSGITVEEGWDFTGKTPTQEGFIIKNYTSGGWQNETETLRAKWTSSSTEPANNYAASPAFTVSAGALLNFDVWRASTGFTEKLEVYVLTTEVADADELDAAITAGTELHLISDNPYTVNSTSASSPDKLSFNLNAYAGQKVHIVFRHCSDGDQHSIYIDNIEIGTPVVETDPKIISGTVETRARTTDADTKTDVRFVIKVQFNESFISVVYPDATTEQFGDTTGKQIIGFGATLSFGFGSHADMELVGRNIWYVNNTYFTFTAVVSGILKTEFNGAATISATPYVKLLEGSTESTVTFATLTQKAEDL